MSNNNNDWVRDRIKFILDIYPGISPSMLQISIATHAHLWKPVLKELEDTNQVIRKIEVSDSPTGRVQTYIKLFNAVS